MIANNLSASILEIARYLEYLRQLRLHKYHEEILQYAPKQQPIPRRTLGRKK